MMSEDEVFRIIGKKRWESFCIFAKVVTTPDPARMFDPEQVSLYCRLRGISVRNPNQGAKFMRLSQQTPKGIRRAKGRPKKIVEWDITQKSLSNNQKSSNKD